MKLIVMTSSDFFVEEDKILSSLFEEGLDLLHIRKPDSEPVYAERLLTLLPPDCHSRIVVHEHFYLKDEFGLGGIHLRHGAAPPAGYRGQVSCSCHSLEEVKDMKGRMNYVFLSPVFDSITSPERKAAFAPPQLMSARAKGIIDRKVMAVGGISVDNIAMAKDYGFGGVVVMGDLWTRFRRHDDVDFKELLHHFRHLRKAAD